MGRPCVSACHPNWRDLAACRGMGPKLFFPGHGEDTSQAKVVCKGCPVREPCLNDALDNGEHFGVWGGTSERERDAIRARRRKVA